MEKYQYSDEARTALETLQQPLAVFQVVDGRVNTLLVSDGFCRLFGFAERARAVWSLDHGMYNDVHPDDVARISETERLFIAGSEKYDVVFRTRAGMDSGYRVIHAAGKHCFTETGARLAHVWYMDEGAYTEGDDPAATGMSRALNNALHEESILKAAHYDELTGLPNLAWFFKLCEIGKARVFSEGKQGVLLYMDLFGMKHYNHKNGFAEGDRLLKAFSGVLVRVFGKDDSCHIGADRFAASVTEDVAKERLEQLFAEAGRMNGGKTLPVRVGVYSTSIEDVPVTTAYDRAKIACDAIRGSAASSFRYYSAELRDAIRRRQYITANIDRAIAEKWIQVYYQPIVRAVNRRVCEEEALARWIDPVEGLLPPAEFIPHLESSGQVWKLDLYMLEQVLEKLRKQVEAGLRAVPHSINLSRSDFDACDIVEEIRKRVDASGFSRTLITIEITESVIGSDPDFMKEQVDRFRDLGFPVWMDDFGSGYSSLDVLQSIRFDLIKFDMSFMRKLDEGDSGKIILTELMKMATSLGVDTVCEGVETEEQFRFLQEIGCSKLQGYYFCRPIPFEKLLERYEKGQQIGFEEADAASYFEAIGRVNLYDLDVIANRDEDSFQNAFNTVPMAILEIRGDKARFVRSSPSYRAFFRRFFHREMATQQTDFARFSADFMDTVVNACCRQGVRAFYNETMPDGSIVHAFARRIGVNPATGDTAVVIAVLSISDPAEGESYADIARALAADYRNIYAVDMDTDDFIEYTSPVGEDRLAEARHGTGFFDSVRHGAMTRIYEEDRELFLAVFTKENVSKALDLQGVFTATYRLIDSGTPVYVNMKVTRLQGTNRIILGVSVIDSQMKQQARIEGVLRERDALARIMAVSEDYLSLYSVDPDTGRYVEYTSTADYQSLGFEKEGADFFLQGVIDGKKAVHPDDLPRYLEGFTKEKVLKSIRETGKYLLNYRLIIRDEPVFVSLKISPFQNGREERLLAGVRRWQIRD